MVEISEESPIARGVNHWHIVTWDERRRDRAGKRTQFPAHGAGLWRPSPTEGVVPREQLKVYFFLPHARPASRVRRKDAPGR